MLFAARTRRNALVAIASLLALAGAAGADITLYAHGVIPADALDLSGQTDTLPGRDNTKVPANRLGGIGSGLEYTGNGSRFLALCDRGPADGAADFACRFHEIDLTWPPKREADAKGVAGVEWKVVRTVLVRDKENRPFVGRVDAIEPNDKRATRFDPESIRLMPGGASVLISDEYGPFIQQHDLASGLVQRSLEIPKGFAQPEVDTDVDSDKPTGAETGRDRNRGFESLAVSPDGSRIYTMVQSPLLQDHALTNVSKGKRLGVNCRIVAFEMNETGREVAATRQFVYPLEDPKNVVCEMLAIDQTRLLVLERDGKGGEEALVKRIYMIDTLTASDVTKVASLPKGELADHLAPVRKALWLDMLAPKLGVLSPDLPEKWESLTFGPDLEDGRKTIVAMSDNDFRQDQPTHVWVFAFEAGDLAWPKEPKPEQPAASGEDTLSPAMNEATK